MNWFKRLWRDERGIAPWIIPAAISGGSALMSWLGGGGDEEDSQQLEPYGGYFEMLQNVARQIGQRSQQPGERYPGSFDIPQPDIESQTERILGERLGNLPQSADYRAQVEASKTQQIAREKERAKEQQGQEQEMYNRLGLVSSTPWMERAGKLGNESLMRQGDIETGMDMYGLDYGLRADETAANIANQYLTQGQLLGSRQRGYNQYPLQMNYEDWVRSQEEPYKWAGLASGMRQEPVYQEPGMGTGETIANLGADVLPYLLMMLAA